MATDSKQSLLFSAWRHALNTEAFKTNHITLEDLAHVLPHARERAFQRLIQALLRERLLSPAHVITEKDHVHINLPHGIGKIRFQHLRHHRMDAWHMSGSVQLYYHETAGHELLFPSDLLECLAALLDPAPDEESILRLSQEFDDSFCNDTLCLAFHDKWSEQLACQAKRAGSKSLLDWLRVTDVSFNPSCLLEQWGTLGHPWHPNFKSKLSMSTEDVIQYSPEFGALITVQAAALHRDIAHCESMEPAEDFMQWWAQNFPEPMDAWASALQGKGLEPGDYIFMPVHPVQIRTLSSIFEEELSNGKLILTETPAFTGRSSMSFRTLWSGSQAVHPMIKLPVALQLTTAQRTVSPRAARMGPRISRLLKTILTREPHLSEIWDFLPERHGVHYAPTPSDDEHARHLGIVCRDNPIGRLHAGELAVPVGSLFAMDNENKPLLSQWIQLAQGVNDAEAALHFFLRYASIVVAPLLEFYLVYGIAFEAHQQNSFMIMNQAGQPVRLLVRDFGDLRIHRTTLQAQGLDLELHDPEMTCFDDDTFVRAKFLHAAVMCHLGELALLCERHWPALDENDIWSSLTDIVTESFDALRHRVTPQRWEEERAAFLISPWPAKAFVKMRLAQTQTDLVSQVPNPLHRLPHGT